MRLTSIDIGTNTILMLIADIDINNFKITPVIDIQKIPRLGKGVDLNRNITKESINTASDILNEYKNISESYNSDNIIASATSFLRDANNRDEFIQEIKLKTGIEIQILSGIEEAKWSFWGAVSEHIQFLKDKPLITIDIGGGSTEISYAFLQQTNNLRDIINQTEINTTSIDIGSVRIKEKFLNHHPPLSSELADAENYVNENLLSAGLNLPKTDSVLIGLAGTITTLGAVKLKLKIFGKDKVDGLILSCKDINEIYRFFTVSPIQNILSLGEYMNGRADVILPGTMILKCFMEKFGFDEIKVSTKGLRYGMLLREIINF